MNSWGVGWFLPRSPLHLSLESWRLVFLVELTCHNCHELVLYFTCQSGEQLEVTYHFMTHICKLVKIPNVLK